ncbi:MAG TPA: hypothetical protein VG755_28045 [Nannocystaceae bacterium]|nr:hypothetical protein [Nannocystaceae bacterium]
MRSSWLGAFVVVVACGPVVGTVPGEGGAEEDATSDAVTSSDTGTSGAVGSSEDSAADESSSTGEPVMLLCDAPDAATPLAVLSSATSASVLHGDGSTIALALPDSGAPADASVYPAYAGRGAYVAALQSWSVFTEGVHYGAELTLFTDAGTEIWSAHEDGASFSTIYLADDGSIATLRSYEEGLAEGVLYRDADDQLVLPDFMPQGRKRDDDWIPGSQFGAKLSVTGWMSTDLEFRALHYPVIWSWIPSDDGELIYLTEGAGAPILVIDEPEAWVTFDLPALGGVDQQLLTMSASPSFGWLLVHDGADGWWRVEVASGATEVLDVTPPDGATMFECYSPSAVIDDAGRLLVATRDATAAAALRYDPSANTWESLGERVTYVDDIGALPFGETLLVRTSGQGTTFCPPQEFDPGTAVLAGTTQQLVRPIDGYAKVLAPDVYPLPDRSGSCAALTSSGGLTLLDITHDLELDPVGDDTFVTWWSR